MCVILKKTEESGKNQEWKMDKEKMKQKYGINGVIVVLMQVQLVLVGMGLIISCYGVISSFDAQKRMIVYILQAVTCLAMLIFGVFHFHKKKMVYFKAVIYFYAALEAVRCALLSVNGVDDWAAIPARLFLVALACTAVILAEHLGEKNSNYYAYIMMFLEAALFLVYCVGFPGVTEGRMLFKILPLVGLLMACSICLFNIAKCKQREYFDQLRAEGKLPKEEKKTEAGE